MAGLVKGSEMELTAAAQALRMSYFQLRDLVLKGVLGGRKDSRSGRWLVAREDVERFARERVQATESTSGT